MNCQLFLKGAHMQKNIDEGRQNLGSDFMVKSA